MASNRVKTFIVVAGFGVVIALLFVVLVLQIAELSTSTCPVCDTSTTTELIGGLYSNADDLAAVSYNNTRDINAILGTSRNSAKMLMSIAETLAGIHDTSTSTAGVISDIQQVIQALQLERKVYLLPSSCQEIRRLNPSIRSGVYTIGVKSGIYTCTYDVYCSMEERCGSEDGWTRVGFLNMSDVTQNCPPDFRQYEIDGQLYPNLGGTRVCGRTPASNSSCVSVQFPSYNISYSQVCGRVVGYAVATDDGFYLSGPNDIDSAYVDGVSITRGSPRQHVWTLAATREMYPSQFGCPCFTPSSPNQIVPPFVGNDYYCEGAQDEVLWDGQDCAPVETACCSRPNLPWFHRNYSTPTDDYLELRVCGDDPSRNEDVPVSFYELYVQ